MMKMTQKHTHKCLLGVVLGMLCWGALTPVQAGPTKSRFDRSYPSISKIFESTPSSETPILNERISEEKIVIYKGLLSDARDVDYATAVTQLSSDMLALEAAQSTFAKVSQLSILNFIR